eukprot:scaffold509_cov315-Pavlova_lutheri.AAC.10
MPSRVGCALERRLLRKQFDELVGLFMGFLAARRLRADVRIGVLRLLLAAIERCWKDLENAKRYWNYRNAVGNVPRTIGGFTDDWLRQHCRFVGWEIRELMRILNIQSTIRVRGTGRVFTGEEGMLLLLRRMATLENLHHLSSTFDRSASALSELHNAMLDHVYPYAKRALRLEVWLHELPRLAKDLAAKGCRIPTCCGFIDGTLFKIRRPTEGEDAAYSGWKRMHATKYQAVVLSNFMIADYDGPHAGSVGDANILRRSNIEARLQAIVDEVGHVVTLYGDGAYPRTDLLHRPFKGNISAEQAAFNEAMSSYRQAVEWIFGKLEQLWPFVGDKTRRTIMLRQTGKEDLVAALLMNFHTCLCGGVTTDYLGIAPPTLEEYEAMIRRAMDGE